MHGMGVKGRIIARRGRSSTTLWPNRTISFIDLRPLRLRPSQLCASVLAHLRRTANINVSNPWYEYLSAVCYHWILVGDASQCADHAVRERQPDLIQSSDWPHVCMYVLKSGLKRLSSLKNGTRLVIISLAFVLFVERPVSRLGVRGQRETST